MKKTLKPLLIAMVVLGLCWHFPITSHAQIPAQGQQEDDDVPESGDKAKKKKKKSNDLDDLDDKTEATSAEKSKENPKNTRKGEAIADQNKEKPTADNDGESSAADAGDAQAPDKDPEKLTPEKKVTPEKGGAGANTQKTTPNKDGIKANKPPARPDVAKTALATSASNTSKLTMEMQLLWGVAAFLALALLLQLLNFLLPFLALRFLSQGAQLLINVSLIGLATLLFQRTATLREIPGNNLYSGLLLFSFVSLLAHTFRRRQASPQIYVSALFVLISALGSIFWALSTIVPVNAALPVYSASGARSAGNFFMYTAFGLLATSGGWLLASGYLGMLARGHKGSGYGLEHPEQWQEYRLQPTFLAMWAYPFLTLAWGFQLIWGFQSFAAPWQGWLLEPRTLTALFSWLLLSAYFFAVRIPLPTPEHAEWEDPEKISKLPSTLLFGATFGGAAFFVGMTFITRFLQG